MVRLELIVPAAPEPANRLTPSAFHRSAVRATDSRRVPPVTRLADARIRVGERPHPHLQAWCSRRIVAGDEVGDVGQTRLGVEFTG